MVLPICQKSGNLHWQNSRKTTPPSISNEEDGVKSRTNGRNVIAGNRTIGGSQKIELISYEDKCIELGLKNHRFAPNTLHMNSDKMCQKMQMQSLILCLDHENLFTSATVSNVV
jgi:hypothetical protein